MIAHHVSPDRANAYSVGFCYLSVCAPVGMAREVIERQINAVHDWNWRIAKDPAFSGGQINPCACNVHANRMHYLMTVMHQ